MSAGTVKSIRRWLAKARSFLKEWQVFAARDPRSVPPRSLVLFPLNRAVLFCGFAGLLTIKGNSSPRDVGADELLIPQFGQIRAMNMRAVLSGAISPVQYLGGSDILGKTEQAIFLLKGEISFQDLFFHPEKVRRLSNLVREMEEFLFSEEGQIDTEAVRFSTSDMEAVNSRLVHLKDIHWALQRDVLENVDRINALAGREMTADTLRKYRKINLLLNCLDRLEVGEGTQRGYKYPSFYPMSPSYNRLSRASKTRACMMFF